MAKRRQNARMWQGEDKSLVFTVTGTTLTTATAIVWELSETERSDDATLTKTLAAAEITADSDTQCTVTLDGADTESINGDYYQELRVTDANALEQVVAVGTLTIEISTTK